MSATLNECNSKQMELKMNATLNECKSNRVQVKTSANHNKPLYTDFKSVLKGIHSVEYQQKNGNV